MRKPIAATIGVVAFITGVTALQYASAAPVDAPYCELSSLGDTTCNRTWTPTPNTPCLRSGTRVLRPSNQPTSVCTPATTTTQAPTTTRPTTTSSSTTTRPPTTTSAPSTTSAPTGGDFVATFSEASDLDRLDWGLYNRDTFLVAQTQWQADHSDMGGDHHCGNPLTTSRTAHRDTDEWFFYCRTIEGNAEASGHIMTSVGDISGYSTAYVEPTQVFNASDTSFVSWDVNITDLKARKWWEVSIVPASFNSGEPTCPHCSVISWLSPSPAGLPAYPAGSIVVGKGPFGNDARVWSNGTSYRPLGYTTTVQADPEASASKAIRRTFTITDNRNDTITITYLGRTFTYSGEFPDQFRVVFKDHSYTPNKDGVPQGTTWHWDNIVVR